MITYLYFLAHVHSVELLDFVLGKFQFSHMIWKDKHNLSVPRYAVPRI